MNKLRLTLLTSVFLFVCSFAVNAQSRVNHDLEDSAGIVKQTVIVKSGTSPAIFLNDGESLLQIQGEILAAAETFNFQAPLHETDISKGGPWGNINLASDGTLFTFNVGEDGFYVFSKDEHEKVRGIFRIRTANTAGKFALTLFLRKKYDTLIKKWLGYGYTETIPY